MMLYKNKKLLAVWLSVIMTGSLVSGCAGKETAHPPIETSDYNSAIETTDQSIIENVENETWNPPIVTGDRNGVINHGYSIAVIENKLPHELRRSDEVVMDQNEALKFLEDTISLPDSDMRFMMGETSVDDPGAYMWYSFYIYKNNVCIIDEKFDVLAFTDGTICEGRRDVLSCDTFADPADMMTPDEALEKYKQESGDDRDFGYCFNHIYHYLSKSNECVLTYMYRYDCGKMTENYTLLINAITGEKFGGYPDAID